MPGVCNACVLCVLCVQCVSKVWKLRKHGGLESSSPPSGTFLSMTYSGVVTKLCPTLHGFIADVFADGRDMSAVLDVMW